MSLHVQTTQVWVTGLYSTVQYKSTIQLQYHSLRTGLFFLIVWTCLIASCSYISLLLLVKKINDLYRYSSIFNHLSIVRSFAFLCSLLICNKLWVEFPFVKSALQIVLSLVGYYCFHEESMACGALSTVFHNITPGIC